jgi:hypothetical protein
VAGGSDIGTQRKETRRGSNVTLVRFGNGLHGEQYVRKIERGGEVGKDVEEEG